jgi:hypothetical protein
MSEIQDRVIRDLQAENADLRQQITNLKEAIRLIKRSISIPPTGGFRKFMEQRIGEGSAVHTP